MTQTDCDALVKIFKELKYNYVHNYSGYSCCTLENIKCSDDFFINSINLSNMKVDEEKDFPEYITSLMNLTEINISNNKNIISFPELQNEKLEKINLSYTSIKQTFPKWISNQEYLKELDLSNTLITEDNSNNEYLFKDTLEKCNLQNTPLCNNILNNEITNSSLPKLCLNSCGVISSTEKLKDENISNNNIDITSINSSISTISVDNPSKTEKKSNNSSSQIIIVLSISALILLIVCIVITYRCCCKKKYQKTSKFTSNIKNENDPSFKKFFPFTTFKNADMKTKEYDHDKTLMDNYNFMTFDVDEYAVNNRNSINNNNNTMYNNTENNNENKKSSFFKNVKDICHEINQINFILFIDSLLSITEAFKNNKNRNTKKTKNSKGKMNENIPFSNVNINIYNDDVPLNNIASCSYDLNSKVNNSKNENINYDINNNISTCPTNNPGYKNKKYKFASNYEKSNDIESYKDINNEKMTNIIGKSNISNYSLNNLPKEDSPKIWSFSPSSDSNNNKEKYLNGIDYTNIHSINTNGKKLDESSKTLFNNNREPKKTNNNFDTISQNYDISHSNSISSGNFRISGITDNCIPKLDDGIKKNNVYRLSEPIINYNKSMNHNSLLSFNENYQNNIYDESDENISIDHDESNEYISINHDESNENNTVSHDERNDLVNKNINNEPNESSFMSNSTKDTGISNLGKRISGFLSLSFNKHSSYITESISDSFFDSKNIIYEEDSERLLSEQGSEIDSELIIRQNSTMMSYKNPMTELMNKEIISEPLIEHSNSTSESINTWNSKIDSILNMYFSNNTYNGTELDEKYIFTTNNSNNNNNNNNNTNSNQDKVNYNKISFISEFKNKLLNHNSMDSNKFSLIRKKLEKNNEPLNKTNNEVDKNNEKIVFNKNNPFINDIKKNNNYNSNNNNENSNDNDNGIDINNENDNYDKVNEENENNDNSTNTDLANTSSYYSCKESLNRDSLLNQSNEFLKNENDIANNFEDSNNILDNNNNNNYNQQFIFSSNNCNQINVTVMHVNLNNKNQQYKDESSEPDINLQNNILENEETIILSKRKSDNNQLIIPRKSSKRISNRQSNSNYISEININRNINDKIKKIPIRTSSINYIQRGFVNENSKEFLNSNSSKYISYWNYESLMSDELDLFVGDIIDAIKVFDDGWIYGRNNRTNKNGVIPLCLLSELRY